MKSIKWNKNENQLFRQMLGQYGTDFGIISYVMKTKNAK